MSCLSFAARCSGCGFVVCATQRSNFELPCVILYKRSTLRPLIKDHLTILTSLSRPQYGTFIKEYCIYQLKMRKISNLSGMHISCPQHLLPRRVVRVDQRLRLRDGAPPLRLPGHVRRRPLLPRLPSNRTSEGRGRPIQCVIYSLHLIF